MRKHNVSKEFRVCSSVISLCLVLSVFASPVIPVPHAAAASKPKLDSQKGTILTGESQKVQIKNVKKKMIKKLIVKSGKKSVATVKKTGKMSFVVKTKKAGKTTVSVTVKLRNKKKYTFKYYVNVSDSVNRSVTIHGTNGKKNKIKLLFFADTPHVPYVSMSEYFLKASEGEKLSVKKNDTDEYTLTNESLKATANVNTKTDLLTTENLSNFIYYSSLQERTPSGEDGSSTPLFLNAVSTETLEENKPVTISFKDYNIDLIGKNDDVLIPFETAANLFFSYSSSVMFYTGRDIYHMISSDDFYTLLESNYLYSIASNIYSDGKRPKDLVEFNYWELMFMLDNQWGNTDRCYFFDAIRKKGMDRALSETDDVTRSVQELLKSSSLKDYQMGLGILSDILYDGGHTRLMIGMNAFIRSLSKEELKSYNDDLQTTAERIGYKLLHTPDSYEEVLDSIIDYKKSINWNNHEYHEYGDTAVYTFDEFDSDVKAWKEYYKNGGGIPDDTFGGFMKSLKKAAENKEIKNFVLDMTSNSGGIDSIVAAMMGVIANDPNVYISLDRSGWKGVTKYKIDKNLDGKFDKADDEVSYPFRFAVVTSGCSFSCGNMLPFYMKSRGIMVLGEHSRGGARAAIFSSTADGLCVYISTENAAVTWDGVDVDAGVEPDKTIEIKKDKDGKPDYSNFFDIQKLSQYINDFYNSKQ